MTRSHIPKPIDSIWYATFGWKVRIIRVDKIINPLGTTHRRYRCEIIECNHQPTTLHRTKYKNGDFVTLTDHMLYPLEEGPHIRGTAAKYRVN